MTQTRQPAGVPSGGQFATETHAEADVDLGAGRWMQCAVHGMSFPPDQYQAHCDELHGGERIAVRDVEVPDPRANLLKVLDELDEPLASGCDRDELVASVKPGDHLLVESSTRGGGVFLSLHDSADDAASYNVDQEYPDDWEFVEVIALDSGARFSQSVSASAVAEPAGTALGAKPTREQIGAMRAKAWGQFCAAANDVADAAGRAAALHITEVFPSATWLQVDCTRDGRDVDVEVIGVHDAEGLIADQAGFSRDGWESSHGNDAFGEFEMLEP